MATSVSSPHDSQKRPGLVLPAGKQRWLLIGGALVVAYLVYAPALLLESFQRTLAGVFMFATLALAWNIIGGFAGYASFGNVAFFGLGGYAVATLMTRLKWPFWPALVIAALVATAFAVIVGLPVLRLRGHYFAIATLGVAEGMREIVINLTSLTGGNAGITIPAVGLEATTSYPGETGFYYYFLVLMLVSLAIVWLISNGRFGYALRAIAQDEDAAASIGINTTRTKVAAFALSGMLTALAGSLFAFQLVNIYPPRMFSVEITVLTVVMAVIGGAGTVLGPLIGAVTLQFVSEYLRTNFLDLHTFIFGAIIIVAVLFLPQGAMNFAREAASGHKVSFLANLRRHRI
jgi:branched-chain amino acid transport system permease protein